MTPGPLMPPESRRSWNSAEEALAGHQQAEEELNRDLENRRRELFTALAEAAQFKSRFENAQKRLAALRERLDRHAREAMQLAERREQLRQRADELEKEIATGQRGAGNAAGAALLAARP